MNDIYGAWCWNDGMAIYHHGIKGMKWGVRRYQNKDGTLTAAGKLRLREIYSDRNMLTSDKKMVNQREKAIEKSGVKHIDDETDVIAKGTVLNRVSGVQNESLDGRKYASVTNNDSSIYRDLLKRGFSFGSGKQENVFNYRLEAVHDLTVANGKAVTEKFLADYGNQKLRNLYKEYTDLNLKDNYYKTLGLTEQGDAEFNSRLRRQLKKDADETWAGKYADKVKKDFFSETHKLLYSNTKINSDVCKYYADKGYDAIVDIEDYLGGFDYPIILLNPEKSVKKKSVRKIK